MVHCERANRELLNAGLQNSQTPDGHFAHRDCPDRRRTKSECTDRQFAHGGAARFDLVCSTLRLRAIQASGKDGTLPKSVSLRLRPRRIVQQPPGVNNCVFR